MTPDEEKQALRDLVESDGWRLYLDQIEAETGPRAFQRAIDAALETCTPEQERGMTSRISEAFKRARRLVLWPEERLRALTEPPKPADAPALNSELYRQFKGMRHAPTP